MLPWGSLSDLACKPRVNDSGIGLTSTHDPSRLQARNKSETHQSNAVGASTVQSRKRHVYYREYTKKVCNSLVPAPYINVGTTGCCRGQPGPSKCTNRHKSDKQHPKNINTTYTISRSLAQSHQQCQSRSSLIATCSSPENRAQLRLCFSKNPQLVQVCTHQRQDPSWMTFSL